MFRSTSYSKTGMGTKLGVSMVGINPKAILSTFDPTTITGLTHWYKADAITGLTDGQEVVSWTDSSGGNRTATQSLANQKPIYKTNIKNGLPLVRFDGSNDYMDIPSSSFSGGMTVVVAGHWSGSGGNNGIVSANQNSGWDYDAGDRFTIGTGYNGGPPSGLATVWRGQSTSNIVTPYHLFAIWAVRIVDAGSGTINIVSRKNGSQLESVTKTASTSVAPLKMTIGCRLALSGYCKMDVAEILIYKTDIGTTNLTNVESYLNTKYVVY